MSPQKIQALPRLHTLAHCLQLRQNPLERAGVRGIDVFHTAMFTPNS